MSWVTYGANPVLRDFETIDNFLPRDVPIRGIQHENRSISAGAARVGEVIILKRDYDNLIERNAIGAFLNGQQIGFLPREMAQVLAPEMDVGVALRGVVVDVERGVIPRITIRLETNP